MLKKTSLKPASKRNYWPCLLFFTCITNKIFLSRVSSIPIHLISKAVSHCFPGLKKFTNSRIILSEVPIVFSENLIHFSERLFFIFVVNHSNNEFKWINDDIPLLDILASYPINILDNIMRKTKKLHLKQTLTLLQVKRTRNLTFLNKKVI